MTTTPLETDQHLSPLNELPTRPYENDPDDYAESDSQRLLPGNPHIELPPQRKVGSKHRAFFIRSLALLCAMSFSIGSH